MLFDSRLAPVVLAFPIFMTDFTDINRVAPLGQIRVKGRAKGFHSNLRDQLILKATYKLELSTGMLYPVRKVPGLSWTENGTCHGFSYLRIYIKSLLCSSRLRRAWE